MHRSAIALSLMLALAITAPVVAQSPPPYPEDAGLTFEPVGPSTWRVVEPDLDCEREPFLGADVTAVAPDGRVWLMDPTMGVRQLGDCALPVEGSPFTVPRGQALAPDGTLWVMDGDRLLSWSDGEWVVHLEGEFNVPHCTRGGKSITYEEFQEHGGQCSGGRGPNYLYLDIAPDGSVWLSGPDRLGVYDADGWRQYTEEWMGGFPYRPGFGPDGSVWVYARDGLYVFYP